MKKTIISTEKLNSIAETFQELSGSNEPLRFDQIVEKAEEVKSQVQGGGNESEWVRPSDWPQYTPEMIEAPFEGVYYTVDITIPAPYFYITVGSTNGAYVDTGTVENGVFNLLKREELDNKKADAIGNGPVYIEYIDKTLYSVDYLVYRITPKENGSIYSILFGKRKQLVHYEDDQQSILEIYGRLSSPITTAMESGSCSTFIPYLTKSVTLKDMNPSITSLYRLFGGESGKDLENINLINFNATNITNMSEMFRNSQRLQFLNLDIKNADNVTNVAGMFKDCQALKKVDLKWLTSKKITSASQMFQNCYSLETIDLSNFDLSNIANLSQMFDSCYVLEKIKLTFSNTDKVTNTASMFNNCRCLKELDLSNFDTSNVTNMNNMFYNCISLKELNLSNFDTSNVTSMINMFYNCISLKELNLSNFDTSNVTSMINMFNGIRVKYLDLSNFDTSKVTDMGRMFDSCKIKEINASSFNLSSLSTFTYPIFIYNSYLQKLSLSDGKTHTVNQKSWVASPLNNYTKLIFDFGQAYQLKFIDSIAMSKVSTNMVSCHALTKESLLVVLNALPETTTTLTLTLSKESKALLSDEEIEIATEKGWTVA